jgi:hypothetical protein
VGGKNSNPGDGSEKIRIRDKHPRSVTLLATIFSSGYVGADLSALVREGAIAAVNRVFSSSLQQTGGQRLPLHQLLGKYGTVQHSKISV